MAPVEHETQVPLAPKTSLGVGGSAERFICATSEGAACAAVEWADDAKLPVHVLGGGSNVVVADGGVPGVVVEIAMTGVQWADQGRHMLATVSAGEHWDTFVERAVEKNLAGVECLSGIPGRVGATPIQNVGAYGQDVSETIENVRCFDRQQREIVDLSRRDCCFSYRNSRFKSREPGRYLVLAVSFRLERGGDPALRYAELGRALSARAIRTPDLQQVRDLVIELRRGKGMLLDAQDPLSRSCGSFFVNPIVERAQADAVAEAAGTGSNMPRFEEPDGRIKLSAGWLIEQAGFPRGTAAHGALVSPKHALALIATDGAKATDIVALARQVRDAVLGRFSVRLVAEPVCWGFASLQDGLPPG